MMIQVPFSENLNQHVYYCVSPLLRKLWTAVDWLVRDSPEEAAAFVAAVAAMKVSSALTLPLEVAVSTTHTTMSRIVRYAVDPTTTTVQADLDGARFAQPVTDESGKMHKD